MSPSATILPIYTVVLCPDTDSSGNPMAFCLVKTGEGSWHQPGFEGWPFFRSDDELRVEYPTFTIVAGPHG